MVAISGHDLMMMTTTKLTTTATEHKLDACSEKKPLVATVEFKVQGMTCLGCASTIRENLSKSDGIESINLFLESDSATVSYDPSIISKEEIMCKVRDSGFGASLSEHHDNGWSEHGPILCKLVLCLVMGFAQLILCMFFMNSSLYSKRIVNNITRGIIMELIISTMVMFIAGRKMIYKGLYSLFHGTPGMDLLIAVGVCSSYFYSLSSIVLCLLYVDHQCEVFLETATTLLMTSLLGKHLEYKAKMRCTEYLQGLESVFPTTAIKIKDECPETVPINQIKAGDMVKVFANSRVPVDGLCLTKCTVDESIITGESFPVLKMIGDALYAGSVSLDDTLLKSTAASNNTLVHQISRSIKKNQDSKPKIQAIADVLAKYFVFAILAIGASSFVFWNLVGYLHLAPDKFYGLGGSVLMSSMKIAVTVITIACPCALGLSAPMAIVVGKGSAAKKGIIITNSQAIDNSSKIDTIVLDKTGTLTIGKPEVIEFVHVDHNFSRTDVLLICLELEKSSTHILASSIKKFCLESVDHHHHQELVVQKIVYGSNGVCGVWNNVKVCLGNSKLLENVDLEKVSSLGCNTSAHLSTTTVGVSMVYFAIENNIVAMFAVGDRLRPDVPELVQKCRGEGYRMCILSGDQLQTTKFIANQTGIAEYFAEKSPFEKAQVIAAKQEAGCHVCFVGDGINDSPGLGLSNVSIALGTATDLTAASADIVLLKPSLKHVHMSLKICKLIRRKIVMNFVCAVIYNVIAIPLAFGAFLTFDLYVSPTFSGIFMALSSISVILNSLTLKREIN